MVTKLSNGNKETIFLNIYRPPSSKISTFHQEFQNLLEIFVPSPSELIISGDFNIHADSDLTIPLTIFLASLTPPPATDPPCRVRQ